MAFPSIFIIFIIFVVLFQYHLRKNMRQENINREQFWSKEEKSLSTRRKEFTENDYIQPDLSKFSFPNITSLNPGQELHYQQVKNHINELSSMDLMNFSGMTNTELRIRYGTANQTVITQNEANYIHFLKSLADYGHLMIEFDEFDEAVCAFEECIRLGSDYSIHFTTLAQLYLQKNQKHKLSDLKEKAESLESPNKPVILKKLATF